eukprot:6186559-Pleurochrysis_carterae.AAC.11
MAGRAHGFVSQDPRAAEVASATCRPVGRPTCRRRVCRAPGALRAGTASVAPPARLPALEPQTQSSDAWCLRT